VSRVPWRPEEARRGIGWQASLGIMSLAFPQSPLPVVGITLGQRNGSGLGERLSRSDPLMDGIREVVFGTNVPPSLHRIAAVIVFWEEDHADKQRDSRLSQAS